jgi:hypothetical protein
MYRQTILAHRPDARIIDSDNSILRELCRLGYHRFVEGKILSAFELKANYIRPSDAETGPKLKKAGSASSAKSNRAAPE